MRWQIKQIPKKLPELRDTILVEGLPGIGNVGKVAADFIIEKLGAKKLYEFSSHKFPPSVFINEKNLVELPSIQMYSLSLKDRDMLILAGDVQPIDEESSYEFCEKILDIAKQFGCKEIVTLGGIGLPMIPKEPKVYCTGNSKKMIKTYNSKKELATDAYGVIGPIIGVSGLLLGLAKPHKIDAIALLAETYGHPMYLGVKGAKLILNILKDQMKLDIDLESLEEEIEEMEKLNSLENLENIPKKVAGKLQDKMGSKDVNYIG